MVRRSRVNIRVRPRRLTRVCSGESPQFVVSPLEFNFDAASLGMGSTYPAGPVVTYMILDVTTITKVHILNRALDPGSRKIIQP